MFVGAFKEARVKVQADSVSELPDLFQPGVLLWVKRIVHEGSHQYKVVRLNPQTRLKPGDLHRPSQTKIDVVAPNDKAVLAVSEARPSLAVAHRLISGIQEFPEQASIVPQVKQDTGLWGGWVLQALASTRRLAPFRGVRVNNRV